MSMEQLLGPGEALALAGCALHWIASDPERLDTFARDMEHHPGDLDTALVTAHMDACHRVLDPQCPHPVTLPVTELPREDEHDDTT
jgi:hypothetical protein